MSGRNSDYRAAFKVRKGEFHRWLGKSPDEPITDKDIAKGKASNNPHVIKMATFASNARHFKH